MAAFETMFTCLCVCVVHTCEELHTMPRARNIKMKKAIKLSESLMKKPNRIYFAVHLGGSFMWYCFCLFVGFFSSVRKVLLFFFFLSFFLLWQLQWIMYKNLEAWDHCLNTLRGPLSYFCVRCLALKWSFYHFMGISDRSACLERCLLDKTFLCHFKDIFCLYFPCSKIFPGWEI